MKDSIISKLVRRTVLKQFYQIPLSSVELEMAEDAVVNKYRVSISVGARYSLLLIPALLLLDTAIVVSVLLPTTMVAGTAWFSVSLASMKKKFEDFGTELTRDLFVAFTLSLMMLFLTTAFTLTSEIWQPIIAPYSENSLLKLLSAASALIVVAKLLFSIFSGSLKYDVNDAMLTGQNEAAERFFKKSLSLLHTASESLKLDRGLEVANYTIGVAFYEVFTDISKHQGEASRKKNQEYINEANKLISSPAMSQERADDIARHLVNKFIEVCKTSLGDDEKLTNHKSFIAIKFELECLKNNEEDQAMVDTRMSVIFSEFSILIEEFGTLLFGVGESK